MKTLKRIRDLAFVLLAIFLSACPRVEVELPGDISGHVSDVVTKESVKGAEVLLFQTNDSIGANTTGTDGTFLFKNLESSNYSVEVIKENYATYTGNITVWPATTSELEIIISGVPDPEFSEPWLNFGMESTQLSFSISNAGGGILSYEIIPTQDWIGVSKDSGEVTGEPDLIEVTIQKEGLQEISYQEEIVIQSDILGDIQVDILEVYVNYVMDRDSILYRTVRIGDQVWMAENLNTGIRVEAPGEIPTSNNGIIEKLCYDNDSLNCEIYGGLYMWDEMMNYSPADNEGVSITQGICPEGWHIPTVQEWIILRDELGGENVAGGKMKDNSALLWGRDNVGESNESGFSGFPGGLYRSFFGAEQFMELGDKAYFGITYWDGTNWKAAQLSWYDARLLINDVNRNQYNPNAMSVRCVQDP